MSYLPQGYPEFALLSEITALPPAAGFRIWQRKADGYRSYATSEWLVLRGGRRLRHRLSIDIPAGWLLDGELVVPGGDVGDVSTAIARRRWHTLRFEPFDVLTADHDESVRAQPYKTRWDSVLERWPAEAVEVAAQPGPDEPIEVPAEWEGVVGKLMDAPWVPGRTVNAVKWKRSATLVVKIVGFQAGRGEWDAGVGAVRFGLENGSGAVVEVGVAGIPKAADRSRFSADPTAFIGHDCVIKHYGMNKRRLRNPIYLGLCGEENDNDRGRGA